jgi:hypothetical protein
MRDTRPKAARLELQYRHEDFVAAVNLVLSHIGKRAELAALYLLVCAFWGLVLYSAVAFAVP